MGLGEQEKSAGPVCSYNEWDPLEEVIVGVVDGACIPAWDPMQQVTMPEESWEFLQAAQGKPFLQDKIDAANRDLDEFVGLLEQAGVTVRRPSPVDYSRPFSTPDWESPCGLYGAMPRDILLVVGDEILESPMAWRSRYHEIAAYRPLLREYFLAGAKWSAAPRPQLKDGFFRGDVDPHATRFISVIGEDEPTFDAAEFVRCGRDLFVQQSHVTNEIGIRWLERHLGEDYRIHRVVPRDSHPMHIDASLMPLAPGKVLINPERIVELPEIFASWDVLVAPQPSTTSGHCMSSTWISMNVLSLDEKRVFVERQEEATARALEGWGFEPIPCNFRNFNYFGGSFHCATADVRRRGGLESYF
jgi:glycine amidinotransferase